VQSTIGKKCPIYKLKRLALSPYHQEGFREQEIAMLRELGIEAQRDTEAHDTDFYITNTQINFNLDKIDDFNNFTKLMIHPNSGHDNFTVEFVASAKFPIIVGNKIRAKAVSEYILACLFQHITKLQAHQEWVAGRTWDRPLIADKHIMVLGHGNIGKILAATLRPLTSNITLIDPFKIKESKTEKINKAYDVVLLACSLNKTSENIINQQFLTNCSTDLLLINGARGKLVDQQALMIFLKKNPRSFAYLDVFENEPANFNNFSQLHNIQLSSHIAGVSQFLDKAMLNFEKEVLNDFLNLNYQDFMENYQHDLLQNRIHRDESGLFII
jgi:D-3-phosphoglycerate dehydrogenase / 2-oxoglutarate reductase